MKNTLRKEAIKTREHIQPNADDVEKWTALFLETIRPDQNSIIAAYAPKDREFDALGILEILDKQGYRCALPKMVSDRKVLEFLEWTPKTTLKPNQYQIFEPENSAPFIPNIVLVPLLAFDRKGHRLGYGGGYYDATLSHLRKSHDVQAIGVAYAQQACLFNLPAEEHDERLDWVITPMEAHYFGHKD